MPTPKKNSNLRPEPLDAQIVLRVTKAEKRAWNAAARPGKLAQWVRETLNRASKPNKAPAMEMAFNHADQTIYLIPIQDPKK